MIGVGERAACGTSRAAQCSAGEWMADQRAANCTGTRADRPAAKRAIGLGGAATRESKRGGKGSRDTETSSHELLRSVVISDVEHEGIRVRSAHRPV